MGRYSGVEAVRSNAEAQTRKAQPGSVMTHIAIAETLDGRAVDWMEKVSDEQYGHVNTRKEL